MSLEMARRWALLARLAVTERQRLAYIALARHCLELAGCSPGPPAKPRPLGPPR